MQGRLYLVGTPIGNLGDITLRAIETLKSVTRVYAEDTRRTRSLLTHLGIEGKRLLSLHAHSSARTLETALTILEGGEDIAVVTDAGMPTISDPGRDLVRAAREAGIVISVVPGPSAVTTAVAASGLVEGGFCFSGFLPRKGQKRRQALQDIAESRVPTVLFESPHRIDATLAELAEACGVERQVAVCRELTKRFEEVVALSLGELRAQTSGEPWLGELTIVVSAGESPSRADAPPLDVEARATRLLADGASVKQTAQKLTRELAERGIKAKRRDLYARVQQIRAETDPDST